MKATLQIRQAVRPWVESSVVRILIGVSGGADSMALAVATIAECRNTGIEVIAIIVDHQLQDGSSAVASKAQETLLAIGCNKAKIYTVNVILLDGLEASARRARYEAFENAITEFNPDYFFLAHTKNDQAETVLLGLVRGSGTRSLSGIAEVQDKYVRPLLEISRETTETVCKENEIIPWQDPHNFDTQYLRVRIRREILPDLEKNIGPGIIEGLARSARLLREDADALDQIASEFLAPLDPTDLPIDSLEPLPKGIRSRVLRLAIFAVGAPPGSLSAEHLAPVEALITDWHGQGVISLPGGVKVERISGRLSLLHR